MSTVRSSFVLSLSLLGLVCLPSLRAQATSGRIAGRVYTTDSTPVLEAIVQVAQTNITARTREAPSSSGAC